MSTVDLVCFSHVRWGAVLQRSQHLMIRLAAHRRVFFVEESIVDDGPPRLRTGRTPEGITVIVPHLPPAARDVHGRMKTELLARLFGRAGIADFVAWYDTPLALAFTGHLRPRLVVYDCCLEATSPELAARERELLARADLVLTSGRGCYEREQRRHPNVHLLPSSADAEHFRRARRAGAEPADQARLPRPRFGYAGPLDDRIDVALLAAMAARRPDWSLVLIGAGSITLPPAPNIHHLGAKSYDELPAYLGGWDAALVPFVRDEATRCFGPPCAPEYLAAGLPVVSTPIADVVRPYGVSGLVKIAGTAEAFVAAAAAALASDRARHRAFADAFLAGSSWDETVARLEELLASTRTTARRPADPGTRPLQIENAR